MKLTLKETLTWNTTPETLRWWTEYATYKTLKRCRHTKTGQGWIKVKPDSSCDKGWKAERQSATHKPQLPETHRNNKKAVSCAQTVIKP